MDWQDGVRGSPRLSGVGVGWGPPPSPTHTNTEAQTSHLRNQVRIKHPYAAALSLILTRNSPVTLIGMASGDFSDPGIMVCGE